MFQRLYDIFYSFKEYVVLAVLILLSLFLLALNDNQQVKRVRAIATVAFGVVQESLNFIPSYFGLRSENELLRRINVQLMDEAHQLREAKLENLRLRRMVGINERSQYTLIASKVIGKNLTLLRNTLTLDVGSVNGVEQRMPVVGDGGLVGIVTAVSDHYSVVNILLNTDFRASAKDQRSRVDGIVAWDGKILMLKNVPKTLDVKPGDVIITSQYSSSYPPDIRIGLIGEVREQPSTLFKTITVTPAVDFVKLEEVFVLTYTPDEERVELEQHPIQKSSK